MPDRTPAEIAAEGMLADLLRDGASHGCRVPNEHLDALVISGHVDLVALGKAALSALEKEGWVLVPREPNLEMISAASEAANDLHKKMVKAAQPYEPVELPGDFTRSIVIYRAMIAASPHQGGKP